MIIVLTYLSRLIRSSSKPRSRLATRSLPFKLFHQPKPRTDRPSVLPPPERLYGDAYTADALLEENEKIQMKAREDREPGDDPETEYAPVPLMFASDSTHLTNFGSASLWPIYLWFLSLSKYVRVCPTSFSAHHLAYIPSVWHLSAHDEACADIVL